MVFLLTVQVLLIIVTTACAAATTATQRRTLFVLDNKNSYNVFQKTQHQTITTKKMSLSTRIHTALTATTTITGSRNSFKSLLVPSTRMNQHQSIRHFAVLATGSAGTAFALTPISRTRSLSAISSHVLQQQQLQLQPSFLSLSNRKKTSAFTATHHRKVQLFSSTNTNKIQPLQEQKKELGQVLSNRLDGLDQPTVWQEFSPLSVQHGSVNLGQGFPDWEPPNFVKECMKDAIYSDCANQYARSYAHMPLAISLATEYYGNRFYPTIIDPATMVATAVGCTNVLFCALQGLLNIGDEVICLEPSFDIYASQVRMAGGKPVFVPLRDPTTSSSTTGTSSSQGHSIDNVSRANDKFVLDTNELEESITERTKVLLLNSPHNPTGKVFTRKELTDIANIIQKYPHITVISDEVYEHIVFQDNDGDSNNVVEHISIASIPGMFDQTLTLSSSGKTFSCTGWKVGWAIGPARLIKAVTAVQQWVNFSAPTPNQHAIAKALVQAKQPYSDVSTGRVYDTYYTWLASDYQRKRDLLVTALQSANMEPIVPAGGFFIMADTSRVTFPYDELYKYLVTDAMPKVREEEDMSTRTNGNGSSNSNCKTVMPRDWAMSRWLTEYVGVTAIPPSAFYCIERVSLAKNYLRFAFCKSDTTIITAQERFETYFTSSSSSASSASSSSK